MLTLLNVTSSIGQTGAVTFNGGYFDAPNVTLNTNGDWSVFVATIMPTAQATAGTILNIGTLSTNCFKDTNHLSISWNGVYPKAWTAGTYAGCFTVTAKDTAGTSASKRVPNDTFFGQSGVTPLISATGADDRARGLVVQRRSGIVEFWMVDDACARMVDWSIINATFGGITNQPLRIGSAQVPTQPSPSTLWKRPVQSLVIYNGGCLTAVQMKQLFDGADAQNVLDLQAARDDRYYPGTLTGGNLDELVSSQTAIASGSVSATTNILGTNFTDDVIVELDGGGQVLPRDPPPATTTKARFWGTRIGSATDIRMRVVKWGVAYPTASTNVVVDWATVATNVQDGLTWMGDVPGVPNALADYDCEISWQDGGGNWTTAKRLYRKWSLGVVVGIAGQSIVQRMRDDSIYPARSYDTNVGPYLRAFYNIAQGTSGYQDQRYSQLWFSRRYANGSSGVSENYGELRMAERIALLGNCSVGVGNFSVGGAPISNYLGNTERWSRWKTFIQRARPQIGIWGNGQGNISSTKATRFANLDQLLAQYDDAVQTAPGGPWKYKFFVYPMNADFVNNGDAIRSHDTEWAVSRAAQGKPVGVLCFTLDEAVQDGVHPADNEAGHGLLASRFAQTIAHAVGLTTYSGLGPRVDRQHSSWTTNSSGTTADIVLIQNGGTALLTCSNGAPSGFKISIDGSAYAAPATSAIVDATHLQITSATRATNTVSVTYQSGYPGTTYATTNLSRVISGTDNAVYDDRGDITGLVPGFPLEPLPSAHPLLLKKAGGPAVDSDTDGQPDWWEDANGLDRSSASDAALDSDGDGDSNLQEYQAGTIPWDAADPLVISGATVVEGDQIFFQVSALSLAARTYQLEATTNLTNPDWTPVISQPGTGSNLDLRDTSSTTNHESRFYRVVVPRE